MDDAIHGQRELPDPMQLNPLPRAAAGRPGADIAAERERPASRGFVGAFPDAWDANVIGPAITRMMERDGYFHTKDQDFQLTPALMKRLSEGLTNEDSQAFASAVSLDHATAILHQILDRMARQERLAADGVSGKLAQAAIYVIDPILLVVYALVFLIVFLVYRKLIPRRKPKAKAQLPGSTSSY